MTELYRNNRHAVLSGSINLSATSIALVTGQGANLPNPTNGDYFSLTLIGLDTEGRESTWEVVHVTARSGDTLTVLRGREDTSPAAWPSGTRAEMRLTAGHADRFESAYGWGDHAQAGYAQASTSGILIADPVVRTSSFPVVPGNLYRCDSSGGAFNINLYETPVLGDSFGVIDLTGDFATTPPILRQFSNELLMHVDDDLQLTKPFMFGLFRYMGDSLGWYTNP